MGLPGVSARGVAAPAAPPRILRCQRAAMEGGGRGTVTSGTDADLSSEPRKNLKTVYFKRFPRKCEKYFIICRRLPKEHFP